MSLFVQTNVTSLKAQENFSKTQLALSKTMQKLSSGYKINSAADDAAGLGIAMRLNSQVASYSAATQNANTAVAMTQTADGGAGQISDILTRLSQLAVSGASGTMSANDSANLQQEFAAQLNEINKSPATRRTTAPSLLSGVAGVATNFQVGITANATDKVSVTFGGADLTGLGLSGAGGRPPSPFSTAALRPPRSRRSRPPSRTSARSAQASAPAWTPFRTPSPTWVR